MTYLFDDKIKYDDSPNLDAFGRLRTSTPTTLFDSTQRYAKDPDFAESLTGGGTITYEANSATIAMSVSTTGDKAIIETKKVFAYQPGKSLLFLRTFCLSNSSGLIQRVGYFDSNDGIFLEKDDSTVYIVRRSSITGTVQEVRIPKSEWNVDRLDGSANSTNPSGLTLNLDRVQIFFSDIEWLGVGSIRCGFVIDGSIHVVHKINHANRESTANSDSKFPYMKSACLPLRSEIQSTGGSGLYRSICSTVLSEGGYELRGKKRSAGHLLNAPRELSATNTIYPLMSIRLKSNALNGIAIPRAYSILPIDSGTYQLRIINGTTTGGSWANTGSDSIVEYNLTPTSINTGNTVTEIRNFSATNQATAGVDGIEAFLYQLERDPFSNTAMEFIVAMSTITATSPDVVCSIDWQEIT